MSLAFAETFLSSLNSFKVRKYDENSLKCPKNYSPSRIILPECVKLDTFTLKFNKVDTELQISGLDFIITIKKLLNLEKKFTLLKKGKVLKDYKCALDYDLQDGDVLTIFYQKEQVKSDLVNDLKEIKHLAKEHPKELLEENSEKKKFINELRSLLEKYSLTFLEADILNLLPKGY